MASILHLRKQLADPPAAMNVSEIKVRTMDVPQDVAAWLELRERAAAGLSPAPRRWLHADYQREMFDKPWWRPDRTWLATAGDLRVAGVGGGGLPARTNATAESKIVGAVTLAMRDGAAGGVPVVHWLLVDPAWRRRGIGRLLMSYLERAAWDAGWREVQLETHIGWSTAVEFYQSMGYAAVRAPSPR